VVYLRNPIKRLVILNSRGRTLGEVGHFRCLVEILVDKTATVEPVNMSTDFAGADDGVEAGDDRGAIDLDDEMVC
jgi:hypothetical protein